MMQDSRLERRKRGGQMVVRRGGSLDKGQDFFFCYRGVESGSGLCSDVKGSVWL